MNREIKFRNAFLYKDGSFSHFCYWGAINTKGEPLSDDGCFASPSSSNGLSKRWHQQFTGLLDKNGKEIYEGDIVEMKIEWAAYEGQDEDEWKVWYERGKVEFSSGCFWINTNGHSINCHFHYNDSHREVIGNIYENPELLK